MGEKEGIHPFMSRIQHIGFFKFKSIYTAADIAAVWRALEAFQKQIPGIHGFTWGVNSSTEGLSEDFTHSFIVTFENAAARDAYLPHPVHRAAVAFVVPKLERVIVLDHEIESTALCHACTDT